MTGSLEHWIARRVLELVGNPSVDLQLWDDERISPELVNGAARVTIRLNDRKALYDLIYKPTRSFAELYTQGRLEVDCDVAEVLETLYPEIARLERSAGPLKRMVRGLFRRRPHTNTLKGARHNIHDHYDLGNDFYSLWLDREYMQYTCAYYPTENATLEQAQAAKLELICRKLALQPGDSVLEAGSGWGGLARYLVRHYGVKVRSYNISSEQVAYARQRAVAEGLDDQIEYVEDDYRNASGQHDVFLSVGMLEHVGVNHYVELGRTIDRALTDSGRGLIHTIGQDRPRPMNEWIERNIFPGAYPPTLREMMDIFEPFSLSVVDVENLRTHYAHTLKAWRDRFDENRERITGMFDEQFARTWYLYLSGSMSAFTNGQLQLYQVLFTRPGSTALPATREHLFADG